MKNIILVFMIQFLLPNEMQCLLLFNRVGNSENIGFENDPKLKHPKVKVGIVGAGISGLYTALMLQDLGIDYEVFEASNRIGGRIFTHYFNNDASKLNYVDLGAMRLPKCSAYDRILGNSNYSLINYLNSRLPKREKIKLIPFENNNPKNIYFSNGKKVFSEDMVDKSDPLNFAKKFGGNVPEYYASKGYRFWWYKALNYIKNKFNDSFDDCIEFLIKNDFQTFRSYLMDPLNKGLNYPSSVVDWIEAIACNPAFFNHGLFDTYLAYSLKSGEFVKIYGGTSMLVFSINSLLKRKPKINRQVMSIEYLNSSGKLVLRTKKFTKSFDYVVLTPTFAALRNIHFENFNVNFEKRSAMRSLHYITASKVALNFRSRFWENSAKMNGNVIFGGSSETDLKIREIVYPSYRVNCSNCEASLIVSYTLDRDTNFVTFEKDEDLIANCLDDLKQIHGSAIENEFTGKYIIKHWHKDKLIGGAFPLFDSGHFTELFAGLIKPEVDGRLHFAGDTTGIFHGWMIASLISSFTSVKNILLQIGDNEKHADFDRKWKFKSEPDFDKFKSLINNLSKSYHV